MRSGTGTKSGEPGLVTFLTKVMMDCLAGQWVGGAGAGDSESHRSEEHDGEVILYAQGFHGFTCTGSVVSLQ
jgi:hypothetical protein